MFEYDDERNHPGNTMKGKVNSSVPRLTKTVSPAPRSANEKTMLAASKRL